MSSPRYLALTNIRRRSQSLPAATEDKHRPPSTPNRARTIALPCPYRPFRCCIVIPSVDLGLGVVSTRAVVERRQQIGVLRAIGYRRRMIQLSFLLEASFVSLLGILIGTTLGIVLGWQAYNDIKAEEGIQSLKFAVPWLQLGFILALTYGASLLATFIPSRQASRVYPAEALRYE